MINLIPVPFSLSEKSKNKRLCINFIRNTKGGFFHSTYFYIKLKMFVRELNRKCIWTKYLNF